MGTDRVRILPASWPLQHLYFFCWRPPRQGKREAWSISPCHGLPGDGRHRRVPWFTGSSVARSQSTIICNGTIFI